ncbi:1-(5-phosphoribosyl)-5-[(5-phosphoribosylamino)methylideneamino]imidazole-4-carboxamide isomerase [Deinococcus yavapaiensis]|uniref:1-(5-phosphoribosyl)-5-[(5-phosphoribosylamino)methylideneamino] imidazole-4-carboxamide isomerase n=1 Tax=Deinococcus yavapaiensis KR-236 TaxID=694435 RepID=A0A318S9Z7_9DEIO|nr:1-(5-phosphoribosyl)-5-[(5-phosphoribosylamino)methylideneamino]imidazole-4-carboxamide isomerase [Deinococcus yavapaiensis]PYE55970.1 1-(5-phosphoribosyl)-5-[(5-phosphoribosylamino)methylideneamino] imidazole-4-carboxamide isomerase [Deinococcus yavapaiensis KR-236]
MPLVIPCVDIQTGRAVRLFEGDPDRETVYFDAPLDAATHWADLGATLLHLVDLDAATGRGSNRELVLDIARTVSVPVEVGGGVRTLADARQLIDGGVSRVVIGTAAVKDPKLVPTLLTEFDPSCVVVSVDARGMDVKIAGWAEGSGVRVDALLNRLHADGVKTLIFTDVSRDGTLRGLDRDLMGAVREWWPHELIVGGGVANVEDIALLDDLGIEGAIVGRAIYEGTLPYPVPTS